MQELEWIYYGFKPELRDVPGEGYIYDWDTYYAKVDALLESMDKSTRDKFLQIIMKDWTDLEKLNWAISREFLRPYRNSRESVIRGYPEEQQQIIRQYYRADSAVKKELREELTEGGNKLISDFESQVNNVRQNMRKLNPQLDAWLFFCGKTTNLLTPAAEQEYNKLVARFRPGAGISIPEVMP